MKPIAILQHEPDVSPGSIAVALDDLSVPYEVRRLDRGDKLPMWPAEISGVITLGSAIHALQTKEHPYLAHEVTLLRHIIHEGGPVWGICLGAQLLALAAGGDVYRRKHPERGWVEIQKVIEDPLLRGIASPFVAFCWHEHSCKFPPNVHLVAERGSGVQAFRAGGKSWGTLFHPQIDEATAPHWVRDAASKLKHVGDGFVAELQAETERRLPENVAFCHRLTDNFVCAADLLPCE